MKKIVMLLTVLLLTAGIITGCGNDGAPAEDQKGQDTQKEQASASPFPVTVTDAFDQQVVINEKPERIVSLIPSNTEIVYALGSGDEVVGVSDFDNYPEEVTKKEKIGGLQLNIEKIIALKPDLVLAHASSADNSKDGLNMLRESGIPVVVINDSQSFDQVYRSIEMIGKATGKEKESKQLINDMKERISSIKKKAEKIKEPKSVFIEVSPAPELYTPGKNTFMNEMLEIINAKNASGNLEGWAKVDEEAVIQTNPDVIITTYGYYTENVKDKVMDREGWQDVTAVEEEQVYDVHSDLVSRSGPRLAKGVEELAKAVYPELFTEK